MRTDSRNPVQFLLPALLVAGLAALLAAGFAGWLAYGADIVLVMGENALAWCF